jgi:hypothetical protein
MGVSIYVHSATTTSNNNNNNNDNNNNNNNNKQTLKHLLVEFTGEVCYMGL